MARGKRAELTEQNSRKTAAASSHSSRATAAEPAAVAAGDYMGDCCHGDYLLAGVWCSPLPASPSTISVRRASELVANSL